MSAGRGDAPYLPGRHAIEAYGKGGFRFGGMSHRGSLLCLPDGIWAWPVAGLEEISEHTLAPLLSRAAELDFAILGCGREPWPVPAELRARFHAQGLAVDAMTTGAAVRTYNILVGEGRRAAAALLAVE